MSNVIKLTPFSATNNNVQYTTGQSVAKFIGKDGKIGWANASNFFNKDKKLSVQLLVGGKRYYINCSKPIGVLARADKNNFTTKAFINKLMSCFLTESVDEDGNVVQFIGLPEGANVAQMFSASELTPEPFVVSMKELADSSVL